MDAICECGNGIAEQYRDENRCEWCLEEMMARDDYLTLPLRDRHDWGMSVFAGVKRCSKCGLVPVDGSDSYSPCVGVMEVAA